MLLFALGLTSGLSMDAPDLRQRSMIVDAKSLVAHYGNRLWSGYARAPFYVDLIEAEREVLLCAPPEPSFARLNTDPITGCTMQTRHRQLPIDLAASRGISPGVQVIAMGSPARLGMNSADWTLALVHEDFHQYQSSLPGYRAAVSRLGLSSYGSNWMLEYPFPYGSPTVAAAFSGMNNRALSFLDAKSPVQAREAIRAYLRARQAAQASVSAADWRYYEFQIGQEGVAKWTEIAVAFAAGGADKTMAEAARDRRAGLATSLRAMNKQGLGVWKRSVFYVLGPIEAEMLTALHSPWRREYTRNPFTFGKLLERACSMLRSCQRDVADAPVPALRALRLPTSASNLHRPKRDRLITAKN